MTPAYVCKPARTRWRGAIRAALGEYATSWRYRMAVSTGPERGLGHAQTLRLLAIDTKAHFARLKVAVRCVDRASDAFRDLQAALAGCAGAMRAFVDVTRY